MQNLKENPPIIANLREFKKISGNSRRLVDETAFWKESE